MSETSLSAELMAVLDAERAVNEQYLRAMQRLLDEQPRLFKEIAIVRSQQWTQVLPNPTIGPGAVAPIIGRVVLAPDHPYADLLGESFYIAGWRPTDVEFEVVNWAAPAASLFFEGRASDYEIAASVEARRTFVVRRSDLLAFQDDVEAGVGPDPFARFAKSLDIPAAPTRRPRPTEGSSETPAPRSPEAVVEAEGRDEPESIVLERETQPPADRTVELRAASAVYAVMDMPKTGRMATILPTMQPEQYQLVSWSADRPLIVQGQPGTGKTVIAAHRAAYLTSSERGIDRVARIAIVGPSDHYVEHIHPVLAEIKERDANVRVLSLSAWLQQVVGLRSSPKPGRAGWIETSWDMGRILDDYVRSMSARPVPKRIELQVREVVDRLRQSTASDVASTDHREWLNALPPWSEIITQDRYLPVLATVALALNPSLAGDLVGHLIVDEAQDVRPIEWRLLTRSLLEPGGQMSLFGDINQRRSDWTASDWTRLAVDLEITDDEGTANVQELDTGYRSTRQILRFANRLLPRGTRGERALRDGPEPRVVPVKSADRVAASCREAAALSGRHEGLVALISNHPTAASAEFRRLGWTRGRFQHSWMHNGGTVVVLHPDQARGLEFDGAVVDEPAEFPENVGRQGVLYTSLTRANKELTVVHSASLPRELRSK